MKFQIVLAPLILSVGIQAQVFKYGNGKTLEVEFVQEPPCSAKIGVQSARLEDADANKHSITLRIENQSTTPIRAFAMVSGGNLHPTVHTQIFTTPFAAGKSIGHGIWPNSQDHYYFFFDYILYTDGTVCGLDNHHRSTQIAKYLEARNAAIDRVKHLAESTPDADAILAALENGPEALRDVFVVTGVTVTKTIGDAVQFPSSYMSSDNAGPPNPERIKEMPGRAWGDVVMQLRVLQARYKQAADIATKLAAETPKGPADVKKSQ